MGRASAKKTVGTLRVSPDREAVAASVDSIRRVLRALRIAARDTLATTGVSAAQLFVLSALVDGEEASLSDLAQRTMTDRTSVTAVVDRLVQGGLVIKGTSEEDRRRASIRITPKGRTVLRGAPRPPTALLVEALERVEPAELKRLERGLRALTRAMGVDGEPAEMLFEDGASGDAPRASRH
ncbi:MAG TPA: MarR family transcriptional regulator [Gemmatimonadaceae bacterium]|jgi:DNA-binding MarR family transcriptional regulator|nr:MarR family transcriptional regulator [Gemmatimonadaceae bacterium]